MKIIKIATSNGIDDIKIIGETEQERLFIKQLAEAGTLTCLSRHVAESITFRPISVSSPGSGSYSSAKTIGTYNFQVRQNENHLVDLKFETAPDEPLDLSTFTEIKLQLKLRKTSQPVLTLSVGSGLTVTGDDSNILGVAFSAAQTKSLTSDQYYYDILMSTPSSNVYYLEGKINVLKSVTGV